MATAASAQHTQSQSPTPARRWRASLRRRSVAAIVACLRRTGGSRAVLRAGGPRAWPPPTGERRTAGPVPFRRTGLASDSTWPSPGGPGMGDGSVGERACVSTGKPISPPPVTGPTGDGLPAYVSNGVVGLRVLSVPLRPGLAMLNGLAALHPVLGIEYSPEAPYPLAGDLAVDTTRLSDWPHCVDDL